MAPASRGLQFSLLPPLLCGPTIGRKVRAPTGMGLTTESGLPLKWDAKTGSGIRLESFARRNHRAFQPDRVAGQGIRHARQPGRAASRKSERNFPDHYLACFDGTPASRCGACESEPGPEVAGYSIYASPTPATDGKAVDRWFGSAVVAAVDFEGKPSGGGTSGKALFLIPASALASCFMAIHVLLLFDQARDKGVVARSFHGDGGGEMGAETPGV